MMLSINVVSVKKDDIVLMIMVVTMTTAMTTTTMMIVLKTTRKDTFNEFTCIISVSGFLDCLAPGHTTSHHWCNVHFPVWSVLFKVFVRRQQQGRFKLLHSGTHADAATCVVASYDSQYGNRPLVVQAFQRVRKKDVNKSV